MCSAVTGFISGAVSAINGFISAISSAISAVGDFFASGISSIGSALGFAYGKDRVPYNNYPAILHEGEKVLTRNQADQYDRIMSTRGVEFSPTVKELEPGIESDTKAVNNVVRVEGNTDGAKTTTQNVTFNLYNTITEKADADEVVQDVVTKLRKILPNTT